MTPLKEIESWYYQQIELRNRLYETVGFPNEVELCGARGKDDIARKKSVHIYIGIEQIAAALKLPLKIDCYCPGFYVRTVSHLGVTFFQLGNYSKV